MCQTTLVFISKGGLAPWPTGVPSNQRNLVKFYLTVYI